jgi:hypothetical protein
MQEGMLSTSFKKDDKVYIGGDKLLPIERFLPKPKAPAAKGDSTYLAFHWELEEGQRLTHMTLKQRRRGVELLAGLEVVCEVAAEVSALQHNTSRLTILMRYCCDPVSRWSPWWCQGRIRRRC